MRLFSQLKKDKPRAEKEGGVAKESAIQVRRGEGKRKREGKEGGKEQREGGRRNVVLRQLYSD